MDDRFRVHIEAYLKAFASERKRDRYVTLLNGNRKHQLKLYAELYGLDLDESRCRLCPPSTHEGTISYLLDQLDDHLESECVVWSHLTGEDPISCSLKEAITEYAPWSEGVVISVVPGELGIYHSEQQVEPYVCRLDNL